MTCVAPAQCNLIACCQRVDQHDELFECHAGVGHALQKDVVDLAQLFTSIERRGSSSMGSGEVRSMRVPECRQSGCLGTHPGRAQEGDYASRRWSAMTIDRRDAPTLAQGRELVSRECR